MNNPKASYTKLNDTDYRLARAYRLIEAIARRVRAEQAKQRKILANIRQMPDSASIVLEETVANRASENHEGNSENNHKAECGV